MKDLYNNLNDKSDIDLNVITTYPHKSNIKVDNENKKNNVSRIKLPHFSDNIILKYLVEYVFFSILVFIKYLKLGKKFDYIFVSSPPLSVFIPAYIISLFTHSKIITDIRDLWPESIAIAGILKKNSFPYKLLKKFEKFVYKKSFYIFTVSSKMKEYIEEYTETEKVDVIYNGISKKEIQLKNKLSENVNKIKNKENGKLNIYYAGNIGIMQDLKKILEIFNEDKSLKKIYNIKFIGDGARKKELCKYSKNNNLNNVEFLGQMSKKNTLKLLIEDADVLFLNLKNNKLFEMAIPSKLFDYLLVEKPILIGLKGEIRDVLSDLNSIIYFDGSNLGQKLYLLKTNYKNYLNSSENNFNFVKNNFNREKQFDKLYKIISFDDK